MIKSAPMICGTFAALVTSISLACGTCWKDVVSAAEFDRRAWDESSLVLIAIVISAELDGPVAEGEVNRVNYAYEVQEVFKGRVVETLRISTQRQIDAWNSEIPSIGCGDYVVVPGDRLLLFSDGKSDIVLDRCSPSRLIESVLTDAGIDNSWRQTKHRLRQWSK